MKLKPFVVALLMMFISVNSLQAQIWNQIESIAKKKSSESVGKKSSSQADDESSAAAMMGLGKNKVDPSAVPSSYSFSWKYVMEMKTVDGKPMYANYFLEPDASYFGLNLAEGNGQSMLMIMDTKNKISVTCLGNDKQKMASASKMPDYSDMADKGEQAKYTFKTLPNKTILGYNCKGIQATSAEYDIVLYYTSEAKVSFAELYKSQRNYKMPKAFADYFKPGEKTLMLEMTLKDLKNKGKVSTMKCVSLDKSSFVFNKVDYKFM